MTLSPSKFYGFMVFFRALFGIVVFGMANGFILLPVLLSFFGPTENIGGPEDELTTEKSTRICGCFPRSKDESSSSDYESSEEAEQLEKLTHARNNTADG
jgi:hypothetical protein